MANLEQEKQLDHWSNSDGFLDILRNKKVNYLYFSEQEEIDEMIKLIRSYITLLQSLTSKDYEYFAYENPKSAYKELEQAKTMYERSKQTNYSINAYRDYSRRQKVNALEKARMVADKLFRIEAQDLNLVFSKLEDPSLTFFGK